jgi:hypothetical protein
MKNSALFFKSFAIVAVFIVSFTNLQIGYCSDPTPDCPANLLVLLRLDETSGPTYADFYERLDGTASVSPTATTGKIYGGQLFNATTKINIPDLGEDFEWGNGFSFSLECWIKTSQKQAQVAISRYRTDVPEHSAAWWLGINDNGYAALEVKDNWDHNSVILGSTNLADNQWHHLVGVRNGSTDHSMLYVDGVKVADITNTDVTKDFIMPLVTDVTVGYMLRSDYTWPEYHFLGSLDEIAIYTRALTSTEISSFYNSGSPMRHCNYSPVCTSIPGTSATEDVEYTYTFTVDDPDAGDILTISAVSKPNWLNFTWNSGQKSATLSGTPVNANVGLSDITLRVDDGYSTTDQIFTITVVNVNDVPVISGQNTLSVDEDHSLALTLSSLSITDVDNPPTDLTLNVIAGTNYTFSGNVVTPAANFNGLLSVNVRVNDLAGQSEVFPVIVTVNSVNDVPEITSTPVETAIAGEPYMYQMTVADVDQTDILTATAPSLPDWLNFTPGSNGGILIGVPETSNIGFAAVILKVNDGHTDVLQGFSISVSGPSAINDAENVLVSNVYPNPANDKINFRFSQSGSVRIELYNISGNLLRVIDSENEDLVENINVSDLSKGMYFYKVYQSDKINNGKIIIE